MKNLISLLATLRAAPASADAASSRSFDVVASTEAVNSYGYRVQADGWQLERYQANPVVLFGHDTSTPSAVIGSAENVRVEGGTLKARLVLVSAETNPVAEQVRRLFVDGALRAVSVGFRAIDVQLEKQDGQDVPVVTKAELFEISVVPVPADAGALREASVTQLLALAHGGVPEVTEPSPDATDDPILPIVAPRPQIVVHGDLGAIVVQLTALAGVESAPEALSVVTGWKARIDALEAEAAERAFAAVVATLEARLAWTPVLEAVLRELPVATAKKIADAIQPLSVLADAPRPPGGGPSGLRWEGKTYDELAPAERASLAESNRELFNAMREDAQARATPTPG